MILDPKAPSKLSDHPVMWGVQPGPAIGSGQLFTRQEVIRLAKENGCSFRYREGRWYLMDGIGNTLGTLAELNEHDFKQQ